MSALAAFSQNFFAEILLSPYHDYITLIFSQTIFSKNADNAVNAVENYDISRKIRLRHFLIAVKMPSITKKTQTDM